MYKLHDVPCTLYNTRSTFINYFCKIFFNLTLLLLLLLLLMVFYFIILFLIFLFLSFNLFHNFLHIVEMHLLIVFTALLMTKLDKKNVLSRINTGVTLENITRIYCLLMVLSRRLKIMLVPEN